MMSTTRNSRLDRFSDTQIEAAIGLLNEHCQVYVKTGHCGLCGQLAVRCTCSTSVRCGCWELHHGSRRSRPEVQSEPLFDPAA